MVLAFASSWMVQVETEKRMDAEYKVGYWVEKDTLAIREAMRMHFRDFGRWPEGGNAEVITALTNSSGGTLHAYLDLAKVRLDGSGSAIDPWGRPYAMWKSKRPMGGKISPYPGLWVWSSGPDGVSETGDDVYGRHSYSKRR